MPQSSLQIFVGVTFLLLTLGHLLIAFLNNQNPTNETYKKARVIVKSWWYIATPVLVSFLLGPVALMILFFSVSAYAVIEFTRPSRYEVLRAPLRTLFIVSLVLQYISIYMQWTLAFYAFIPLFFLFALPLMVLWVKNAEGLPRLTALVLGSLLIGYYLSHVPALPLLRPQLWNNQDQAMLAILILIFTTELNDILQFISGKSFGRRKLVPEISPNKTEAGFLGGILGTSLLYSYLGPQFLDLTVSSSLILGASVSVAGILGDLLFSSVKRYYKVKDFSDLIPGHGGVLDRLDSLIITAPLYFHLLYFLKGGSL